MFNWRGRFKELDKPLTLGQLGEQWAREEYSKRGYKIVSKNEYNKKGKQAGEIDFIATKGNNIVFVEVKTRTAGVDKFGKGVESVNLFKQSKLLMAVKMFLFRNAKYRTFRPQIDVCSIEAVDIDKFLYSVTILENVVEDWN